jgi:peroxiredoxin
VSRLLLIPLSLAALAAARPAPARPDPFADITLTDATGKAWTFPGSPAKAVVLFVLWPDCPASNGYAPEMARLAGEFGPKGVAFYGVHPDPDLTPEQAARHAKDHGLPFPILLDPAQKLSRAVGATRVPTAAVLSPDGTVRYLGRIDDRYVAVGRKRAEPTRRDTAEAVTEVLAGKTPAVPRTDVFGCQLPRILPAPAARPD